VGFDQLELETRRLILRPVREEDAVHLFPLINDALVAANLRTVPHPYPARALEPWIRCARQAMARRERYEMAVVVKTTGLPIGAIALTNLSWAHMNAELGYWLGRAHWGSGYATEAAIRMVAFGFDELGLERIYACCFKGNPASARVLEKAGMTCEGCARHEVRKNDRFIDVLHYGVIRADYGSVQRQEDSGRDAGLQCRANAQADL
jgi:RimJ/RimL family protein N-acetyltransferase